MLAAQLHIARWSVYRMNVLVWVLTIWITVLIQVAFGILLFDIGHGQVFGHQADELKAFVGLTLLSSGLAQCVVHGVVIHLGRAAWMGKFDHWLTQPPPLFIRLFLEDMGIVWFLPHLIVGISILFITLPYALLPKSFAIALFASIIEIGIVLCLCLPSIRWGRWDPNAGLWEYFDRARGVPVLRSKGLLLIMVSAGVLHYSLSLEVLAGRISFLVLPALALFVHCLAYLLLQWMARSYSSASS